MARRIVRLTGWGRVSPSWSEVAAPATVADAAALLRAGTASRSVIARGLGRSYNNAAQCDGGVVISTARLNRIIELDAATGRASCETGVSLEQLMVAGLPAGWFMPVSPGTSFASHVLAEHDRRYGYTVAWSDSLARGAGLGRSVITSGDFAEPADLPSAQRADPFAFRPGARVGIPPGCPPGLINRYTVALASTLWYRKAPRSRSGELQTIGQFFHPLDGIRNWNRVYGPAASGSTSTSCRSEPRPPCVGRSRWSPRPGRRPS